MSQEEPPFDFRVEYQWKTGATPFNRLAWFGAILFDATVVAVQGWDKPVVIMKLPTPFSISVGYIASRTPVETQIKHVLWMFEEVFDVFVEQDRYAPGTIVVDITPDRLGIGNIKAVSKPRLIDTTDLFGNDLSSNALDFSDLQGLSSDVMVLSPNETLANLSTQTGNDRQQVTVQFQYRDDGATLTDAQVYNVTLKLLIKAAEVRNHNTIVEGKLSSYNDMDDFTFSMVPESAKRVSLTWLNSINSLHTILATMARCGPEGKWAEIDGIVKDLEEGVIGRFCMDKGDLTNLDPKNVCTSGYDGNVDTFRR